MSEEATKTSATQLNVLSNRVDQLRQETKMSTEQTQSSENRAAEAALPQSLDPVKSIEKKLLEGKIIAALSTVYDPEIPVNIYELGLIYAIHIDDENNAKIVMTLTAPACPVAGTLPLEVERKVESIDEIRKATVELVWEPPWTRDMMSESALLALGML
jgi:FeS assembly SUF system protein